MKPKFAMCTKCGATSEFDSKTGMPFFCTKCKFPLFIYCPSCGLPFFYRPVKYCGTCSFDLTLQGQMATLFLLAVSPEFRSQFEALPQGVLHLIDLTNNLPGFYPCAVAEDIEHQIEKRDIWSFAKGISETQKKQVYNLGDYKNRKKKS